SKSKKPHPAALPLRSFRPIQTTRLHRRDGIARMPHSQYDLVIIGSGPAGQKAALSAVQFGKRVALIERDPQIGGVCCHTGMIATGTEPARPANVPFHPGRVIDSNELLQLQQLPASLIVVGGGVIGVEYACMLSAVGVDVTLVESRPRLLEFLDDEVAETLQY